MNSFEDARKLVRTTMISAVVLSVFSVVFTAQGSLLQIILMLAAGLFFAVGLVIAYMRCRCPYCSKVIFVGLFQAKACPRCKRNLLTGKKQKKR